MDVASRIPRLRERFGDAGCDALVVTALTNVRYLTGFTGSSALVVVRATDALLLTDGRYATQAAEELGAAGVDADVVIGNQAAQQEAASAIASGIRRLGLEAAHVSWSRQRSFARDWFPAAELVPTETLVEGLRLVKDDGELARMDRAAEVADEAFSAVVGGLTEGATEREVALALEVEMRRRGATGPAFETIVAAGTNGAKPHARPTDRPIAAGDLVVIDMGAMVDGYRSDMTRTVCLGEPASVTLRRAAEVVEKSQAAGVASVRAGVSARDVDAACRGVIAAAGWGDAFVHGTGHGVGLEIHEAPSVAATSTATLAVGVVVTVEPGVYLPDVGGVRIEDTVVVTADGCRSLTRSPKDVVIR